MSASPTGPRVLAGAAAFPELTDEQLALIAALGERRTVTAGEVLFSPADDHYDFVVMLTASIDIVGSNGELIVTHGPVRAGRPRIACGAPSPPGHSAACDQVGTPKVRALLRPAEVMTVPRGPIRKPSIPFAGAGDRHVSGASGPRTTREQRSDHVVTISSTAGFIDQEFVGACAASGFGAEGWME